MDKIDGINIAADFHDELCLNCRFWLVSGRESSEVICGRGNGYTNPTDYCPTFIYLDSDDGDIKKRKLDIWKKSL